ncbi:unnamed protein product [Sphenostylis stenocarpa]|uniref:Uncharacterized protein n=1 Tax=Sphenostylis stenocarpa TaxID=92480 RepID=A0AA86VW66_9FABA|nr:unnamed protein product [Sphenostylis stenocarpa]
MWSCPNHATSFDKALVPSVSATSWRRSHGVSTNASQQGGKLGHRHTLLATHHSNSTPISKPTQQEAEISGSDILWALQRASARKKKTQKNKKELRREESSVATVPERPAVDYTNVRPLSINANWAAKLDDLEKRLRELSDNNLI